MSVFIDPRSDEIIRGELCTNGTLLIRQLCPAFSEEWLQPREATIYRHARSLEDRAEHCDIITLSKSLDGAGELEQVGGAAAIMPHDATDEIIRSAIHSLQSCWQKREQARIGKELAQGSITGQQAQSELQQIELSVNEPDDEPLSFEESETYDPKDDPLGLLGIDGAWMMRKECGLFFGPSGKGKSTITLHAAATWGMGQPWFGIEPRKPLRTLIIQAENNKGDCHRAIKGIAQNLGFSPTFMTGKIFIHRISGLYGDNFSRKLAQYIKRYDPDIIFIDPIFSFAGADLSLQQPTSLFLRGQIGPVIEQSNAACFLIHHSSKPQKGPNKNDPLDLGNTFFGSVELSAFPRSVTGLHQRDDGNFELFASKRGGLAGLRDSNGELTERIIISHAHHGIGWELVEGDFEPGAHDSTGKKDRLPEYIKNRKKYCPESLVLTDPCAMRIGEEMGLQVRQIRNWEKKFQEQWKLYKSFTLR